MPKTGFRIANIETKTPAADRLYYTVAEAAEVLCVDLKTVYRSIQAGEIPIRRCGRAIRIPRCALAPEGATLQGAGRVLVSEG